MPSLLLRVSKCSCKFLIRWKRKICKIFVKSLFTKKTSSKGWNKCQKGCTYLIVVMKKFQKALILVFETIVYYQIKHICFWMYFFPILQQKWHFDRKPYFWIYHLKQIVHCLVNSYYFIIFLLWRIVNSWIFCTFLRLFNVHCSCT